jgi:general stress protein 26
MDEKLKKEALEFARSQTVSMLATVSKAKGVNARVMMIAGVDDDLTVWYGTYSASDKLAEIKSNPKACVIISDNKTMTDIRMHGGIQVLTDQKTKDRFWKDEWTQFYPKGKTDPSYTVLKFTPLDTEFRNMGKYGHEAKKLK